MMGDRTPRLYGRLKFFLKTFADPVGTYILPALFVAIGLFSAGGLLYYPPFGWGKRHALGSYPIREKRRPILIALAGPAATAILAVAFEAAARATSSHVSELFAFASYVNASLTAIELIPVPGRDGGRVLQRFLPPHAAMRFEEFVQYDVVVLLVLYLILGFLLRGVVSAGCRALHAC
jgi:Zn-dependent protease